MRWRDGRRSDNIEDQRGRSAGRRRGGIGIKGGMIGLVIGAAAIFMGVDPKLVLGLLSGGGGSSAPVTQHVPSGEEKVMADFTSAVLADTEDTWHAIFQQQGTRYQEPKLVMFTQAVNSACGPAQASMGPFYCPADRKIYIDLSFYQDLKQRYGAPGDFAQAYVIAHEVGHHVQNLMGIADQVHRARSRMSKIDANKLSVRQELQADCFAGVWAHHAHRTRQILEQGDIEEALNAATQIGDDTLQHKATGHVHQESFTHGSAAQRVKWFKAGLQLGDIAGCDTFKVPNI